MPTDRNTSDRLARETMLDRAMNRIGRTIGSWFLIFELTETLELDGHAAARRVRWWDGSWELDDDETTWEVYDAIHAFFGEAGKRGVAIKLFHRFVILCLACPDE